jgi:hypothetical protein
MLVMSEINVYINSMATTQPPKRPAGRPRREDGEKTVPIAVRVTEAQKAKLEKLGGAPWVREKIDKAKRPKE